MGQTHQIEKITLNDVDGAFDVAMISPARVSRAVLFSVGGGGDPGRHSALLTYLAGHGFAVVAPHFARLLSSVPSEDELRLRALRLTQALDLTTRLGVPTVGLGHSIGATMLLALSGATLWMGPGRPLDIAEDARIQRSALLAPATGFFRAPGALDGVRIPIFARVGTNDFITPPVHVDLLRDELEGRIPTDFAVVKSADHFSFMNERPPGIEETLAKRDTFLAELAVEVCTFLSR